MIRFIISSLILILQFSSNSTAQKFENQSNFSVVERRYPGGNIELRTYLARSARFPVSAAENRTVGISISSCSISPKGDIEQVEIVNSLCNDIDAEVKRLLHSTQGSWEKADHDSIEIFYFQLCFYLAPISWSRDTISDYNILEPVIITAVPLLEKNKPIESYSDEFNAEAIASCLKNKDYEKLIVHLDEAIRRNPFKPQLYQLRILANSKLRNSEKVMEDVAKTQSFINGNPLQHYLIVK